MTGGSVFGYKNHDIANGEDAHGRPLRSHVERVIDPVEAAVVVRIFELYDSGYGLKRIAKLLTSDGSVTPNHLLIRMVAYARARVGVHQPSALC